MKTTANTVLITGGTSGIGLALAKRLLLLENTVIITGRNLNKLEAVKKEFPQIHIFQCDIANHHELNSLVVYIEQHLPDLNMLINNAAIQYNYAFTDEPDLSRKIDYEVRVNLTAPLTLIGLLLPRLLAQNNAAIVNISSGLGLVPKQTAPVYCGTKAGIHIFTKALRYQLENTNIQVFEVIPPLVDTPMTAGRGTNKISAEQLVDEFIHQFEKDNYEINIGKTRLLRLLQRISPALADRILKDK